MVLKVPAGELREYVMVQRATAGLDAHNGATETWVDLGNAWANVEPLSARELVNAGMVRQQVTHRVRLRYYTSLTPSDRLELDGRIFNIRQVINANERKEIMELLVEEVING